MFLWWRKLFIFHVRYLFSVSISTIIYNLGFHYLWWIAECFYWIHSEISSVGWRRSAFNGPKAVQHPLRSQETGEQMENGKTIYDNQVWSPFWKSVDINNSNNNNTFISNITYMQCIYIHIYIYTHTVYIHALLLQDITIQYNANAHLNLVYLKDE